MSEEHSLVSHCVLVCGGRDYADRWRVFRVLDEVTDERRITQIVHGGAAGADWFAAQWAIEHGVAMSEYKAEWTKFGNEAGPIRNQLMLEREKPDLVVAFPGGRGTRDMVRRAKKAGVPVREEQ